VLTEEQRRDAAVALVQAERAAAPIGPLHETYPGLDAEDAYDIQRLVIAARLNEGARVVGHKVGLTSPAMQEQFGVREPDYGHLLSDMFVLEGASIAAAQLCAPRIEPELAFVLGDALPGPGVTVAHVLKATAFVVPALEIIDSRIADWSIRLPDTVADNASSARVVLGGRAVRIEAIDPRLVGVVLYKNGEVAQTGASGAVLGNPASAVCWLANKLAGFGQLLQAGQVVLSGSCTQAVQVTGGDQIRAEFDELGYVSVRFENEGVR
jgi:2-keto-4-pentenoate hydratase